MNSHKIFESHAQRACGFSLIEVLMVMAIFSIGILAVMTLHITAINSNNHAGRITTGSAWLGDRFEKIIPLDFSSPELAVGATHMRRVGRYSIEHTVSATPLPNVKKIDITVVLDDATGRTASVTYYKAKKR